jgi:hypothetical protein
MSKGPLVRVRVSDSDNVIDFQDHFIGFQRHEWSNNRVNIVWSGWEKVGDEVRRRSEHPLWSREFTGPLGFSVKVEPNRKEHQDNEDPNTDPRDEKDFLDIGSIPGSNVGISDNN